MAGDVSRHWDDITRPYYGVLGTRMRACWGRGTSHGRACVSRRPLASLQLLTCSLLCVSSDKVRRPHEETSRGARGIGVKERDDDVE
jgi:hypothetical protein